MSPSTEVKMINLLTEFLDEFKKFNNTLRSGVALKLEDYVMKDDTSLTEAPDEQRESTGTDCYLTIGPIETVISSYISEYLRQNEYLKYRNYISNYSTLSIELDITNLKDATIVVELQQYAYKVILKPPVNEPESYRSQYFTLVSQIRESDSNLIAQKVLALCKEYLRNHKE